MNTIEPPALMSRIMIFVLAAALATVVVLAVTLANLMPLNRTQIFFLTAHPRANTEIRLQSFSPNDANIEIFKENFIKEYIRMRSETIPNVGAMRTRWRRGGLVNLWSTPDVFREFARTRLWNRIAEEGNDSEIFPVVCRVEFQGNIVPYRAIDRLSSEHLVKFRHFCFRNDNAGHEESKDYTIVIGIRFQQAVRWSDRLENPLGMVVFLYRLEDGERDPLDRFR